MARPMAISDDDVAKLRDRGLTAAEIVKELNATRSTVYRALRRLEKVRPYQWHDDVFPWDNITPAHQKTGPSNYIRTLSLMSRGKSVEMRAAKTAFNWARFIIESGYDLDYDPDYEGQEVHESGGYKLIPENPPGEGWLRKLHDAAENAPSPE